MKNGTFSLQFSRITPRKDGGSAIDYKEVLKGVMSKLNKADSGKFIDLIENDDTTEEDLTNAFLDADKARIAKLAKGSTFQDGYKKAKAEERAAFETEIKSQNGIDEGSEGYDLTGTELIDFIIQEKTTETVSKTSGKDPKTLTTDEIRALPNYNAIAKEHKKQLTEMETQWKDKVSKIENDQNTEKVFSSLSEKALEELAGLNPVLPGSEKVANTHKQNFINALKGHYDELRKDDDGEFTFLKEGKVLTDDHGNPITHRDLVKRVAPDFFEFSENNGGQNSGADPKKKGTISTKGYPQGYSRPKNLDEYAKIIQDKSIPLPIRNQFKDAYNNENSATGD